LVDSLGKLTAEVAAITAAEYEHAKLKKVHNILEGNQGRLKNVSQFPSTMAIFSQHTKDSARELSMMDQKMESRGRLRLGLEQAVTTILNAHLKGGSVPVGKVEEIQDDAKSALATANDLEKEMQAMRNEIKTLRAAQEAAKSEDGKLDSMEKRLREVSNLVGFQISDILFLKNQDTKSGQHIQSISEQQKFAREARERLDELEREHAATKLDLQNRPYSTDIDVQLGKVQEVIDQANSTTTNRLSKLDERLQLIEKSTPSSADAVKQTERSLEDLKARLTVVEEESRSANDLAVNYEVALRDVKGRVAAVDGLSKSASSLTAKVEVALKELKDRITAVEKAPKSGDGLAAKNEAAINDIADRVKILEVFKPGSAATAVPNDQLSALKVKVEFLDDLYKRLVSQQAENVDTEMEEIEKLKATVTDQLNSLAEKIKTESDEAAQRLKTSTESQAEETMKRFSLQNQSILGLRENIERRDNRLQAVETAIVSLETRYNHLTTEPIVRQMLTALQEIYPSPQVMMDQIAGFNKQLSQLNIPEVSRVPARLETLIRVHNTLVEDVRNNRTLHVDECQRLLSQHASLLQKVEAQQPELEKVPALVGDLDTLRKDLTSLNDRVQSEEETRREIIQEMNQNRQRNQDRKQELEQIKSMIESLTEQIQSLSEDMNGDRADVLKAIEEKIHSTNSMELKKMYENFHEMEGSVREQIKALQESSEAFKETGARELRRTMEQLEELERSQQTIIESMPETAARLEVLERAKEAITERMARESSTSTSTEDSESLPYRSGKLPKDSREPSSSSTRLHSPIDANEVAGRATDRKNKKRKLNSGASISDEAVENASATSDGPSARSSPAQEEGSSQLGRGEQQNKKKKRKKKHRLSEAPQVIPLDD
jgi:DNA repair exonuclease SbcCD ATPase subunit